ncbi:MAG TPA: hypothetical protein VGQ83_07240 [Polyangia bacterium]|jgi:ABC-type transporter Mla MlaB component
MSFSIRLQATTPPVGLTYQVRWRDGTTVVELSGEMNRTFDLAALARLLRDDAHVELDLAEVDRVDPHGVRAWLEFLGALAGVPDLRLVRCSPAVAVQLNLIYGLPDRARVVSLLAPYVCPRCGHEEEKELAVAAVVRSGADPVPPEVPCPRCGGSLALDEMPERYLRFLRDPAPGSACSG